MIIPVNRISHLVRRLASQFLGLNQEASAPAGFGTRAGLFISGAFLVAVGLLIVLVSDLLVVLAIPLFLFAAFNLVASKRVRLSLVRGNLLSLAGQLCASVVLYLFMTRILWVTYTTDSIVATYMGVLKVLSLQNPYGFSMKPFLDQFGFPPSLYTPHVDGSFEYHLNYGALNFLTLLPLYAAGLHDLRDGVFIFHIVSILLIFGLVPSRQKALSLAPFVFFPAFVAASWTDSVWAFFFILSSPSSWWASTIVPYFPGAAAMVPGGVGLSEIFLDIGIAPSPIFFTIMMGLVSVASVYLYATRFAKSRYYVWIFPVVIMFFYYRSFPTYIFFWAFPLALEFFRYRPALSFWHFSPFKGTQWRPTIAVGLRSVRGGLRVPLLAGLLLTTVFVGAYGTYVSSSQQSTFEVRINSVADPDGIGAGTNLNITLSNSTPKPIAPLFFIKWNILPYLWTSNSNSSLAPSSTASYLVTASDALAALPRLANFRVFVYDANTGDLAGESLPYTANIPQPSLANPHFRWWTLDFGAGTKVPFSWKLTKTNVDPLTSVIQGLDQNRTAGISLQLNYTSPATNLERVMISQKILLNATTVELSLFDPVATSTGTRAVLGIMVTDGAHELSYIFSNTTAKPSFSVSGYNATTLVPVAASAWTTVSIDANQAWQAQGWAAPNQVTFTIFLQASSIGLYSVDIRGLTYISSTK